MFVKEKHLRIRLTVRYANGNPISGWNGIEMTLPQGLFDFTSLPLIVNIFLRDIHQSGCKVWSTDSVIGDEKYRVIVEVI